MRTVARAPRRRPPSARAPARPSWGTRGRRRWRRRRRRPAAPAGAVQAVQAVQERCTTHRPGRLRPRPAKHVRDLSRWANDGSRRRSSGEPPRARPAGRTAHLGAVARAAPVHGDGAGQRPDHGLPVGAHAQRLQRSGGGVAAAARPFMPTDSLQGHSPLFSGGGHVNQGAGTRPSWCVQSPSWHTAPTAAGHQQRGRRQPESSCACWSRGGGLSPG